MLILPLIAKGDVLFLLLNTEVKPICGVMLLQSEFKRFFSHSPFLAAFFSSSSFIIPCPHPFTTPQCLLLARKLLRGSEQVAPETSAAPGPGGAWARRSPHCPAHTDFHKGLLQPQGSGNTLPIGNVCECFQTPMGQ